MSLHLVERLRIGRGKWTDTRLLLQPYVNLSPYYEISQLRMSLSPDLVPYPFDEHQKLGVVANLHECLVIHLLRGVQYWSTFITPCECVVSCICFNYAARIVGCADGRGDEKEHAQKSQVSVNTTHAFSLMYNLPSIHILDPIHDVEAIKNPEYCPAVVCEECAGAVCGRDLNYDPTLVPDPLIH